MEDQKIVGLYWERDERAIHVTAEKYGKYCFSIAKNILGSSEDAEECVNDTYLNAWETIPPHRPALLSTFLGKITRNLSLNRYKHNTAHKRGGGQAAAVLDELADCVSDGEDVEQTVERQELVKAINSFLAVLPQEKRSIFICRYWYFDSVADIARRFGIRENNVSVMLNRLRAKLCRHLNERGFYL